MIKKIVQPAKRRGRVVVRHRRARESAPARPDLPWSGQQVRIEELPAFLARWGLKVTGGDPDLDGEPWRPVLYVVEM
jgi:hypothetical protein